jgi:hypothetical protein
VEGGFGQGNSGGFKRGNKQVSAAEWRMRNSTVLSLPSHIAEQVRTDTVIGKSWGEEALEFKRCGKKVNALARNELGPNERIADCNQTDRRKSEALIRKSGIKPQRNGISSMYP